MIRYFPDPEKLKKSKVANPYSETINWFGTGNTLNLVDDLSAEQYHKELLSIPGLKEVVEQYHPDLTENQQFVYMELLLHGLAEFSLINKSYLDNGYNFADMFNSLFSSGFSEEDDDDYNEDANRY
jgi:magnesium chelatase subunit I